MHCENSSYKQTPVIDIKTSAKLLNWFLLEFELFHKCKQHFCMLDFIKRCKCANACAGVQLQMWLRGRERERALKRTAIDQWQPHPCNENPNRTRNAHIYIFGRCHVVFHCDCHFFFGWLFQLSRNWNWWYIVYSTLKSNVFVLFTHKIRQNQTTPVVWEMKRRQKKRSIKR